MKREQVLNAIKKHKHQLTEMGVKSLAIFGSVARDDAGPDSDVDILVEFDGLITFDRFMETKFYLEDLLGCKVDLVMPQALKSVIRSQVLNEAIYVA